MYEKRSTGQPYCNSECHNEFFLPNCYASRFRTCEHPLEYGQGTEARGTHMRSIINAEENDKVIYARACKCVSRECTMPGFIRDRSATKVRLTKWNMVQTFTQ